MKNVEVDWLAILCFEYRNVSKVFCGIVDFYLYSTYGNFVISYTVCQRYLGTIRAIYFGRCSDVLVQKVMDNAMVIAD